MGWRVCIASTFPLDAAEAYSGTTLRTTALRQVGKDMLPSFLDESKWLLEATSVDQISIGLHMRCQGGTDLLQ